MPVQLVSETQKLVELLLYDEDQDKRREALKTVKTLPDKDQVEKYLLEVFDAEEDRWSRTWTLSVLSEIGLPDGMQKVLYHTASQSEADPWVRHFALLNAANFTPFPLKEIECAIEDEEVLPKATAFRLLLGNGMHQYVDELMEMLDDSKPSAICWGAARALRNRSDIKIKPLPERFEKRFIQCLTDLASNRNVYSDTRWEAIQALASFVQKGLAATELSGLLVRDKEKDPAFRRYCLDALISLEQPGESQDALLHALEDDDAQIRLDAARALKKMIGEEKCIKILLPLAMGQTRNTDLLVDALRHINRDLAAKELFEALSNPDVKVSTRATELLTILGGQAAAQILMNERAKALQDFNKILTDADQEVRQHFQDLMSQAKTSFRISMGMHLTVFGIGVAMLLAVMVLAVKDGLDAISNVAGVGGVGASLLIILLTTFYKDPLQNVRTSLNALMQVDVVFLGYVRQINQIDATFKHMFLGAKDFGAAQMRDTVKEIQSSVAVILDEINKHIYGK